MSALFFSRIRLKPEAAVQAIAELLLPAHDGQTLAARHKLMWSLFADDHDRVRDFLWREDKHGVFYTLSSRRPESPLFHIESKEFAPVLQAGDQLAFSLRANPVVSRRQGKGRRGQRHDVVMDRLRAWEASRDAAGKYSERRIIRQQVIQQAGEDWLAAQGQRHGFRLLTATCSGYRQHRLPRREGSRHASISTLDFDGLLEVVEPAAFLQRIQQGFGPAKAFGCGLMLIRRT